MQLSLLFSRLAKAASRYTGHPITFLFALAVVIAWAVSGPIYGFSDTWQLVINTGTTVATFLMVFLIQATQNRDAEAMQIKLDELIRAVKGARNTVISIENLSEEELNQLRERYAMLAEKAQQTAARLEEAHEDLAEAHEDLAEAHEDLHEAHTGVEDHPDHGQADETRAAGEAMIAEKPPGGRRAA